MKDNRLWAVLIIIIAQFLVTNGASLGNTHKQQQPNNHPTIHQSHQIRMYNTETELIGIMDSAAAEAETNCEMIANWKNPCKKIHQNASPQTAYPALHLPE